MVSKRPGIKNHDCVNYLLSKLTEVENDRREAQAKADQRLKKLEQV